MTAIISAADQAVLARPHVARAWFGVFDFPDGIKYLHSGEAEVVIGGQSYLGVADPLGGRLVGIEQVEEPQFGQAAAVQITLSGVTKEFLQSVHATARQIEGRSAALYWAAFDGESEQLLTALIPRFIRARMSAPSIHFQGIGIRFVSITLENIWSAQNFPPGGRWNPADQRRRYPGDKGLDFVGVEVTENWT